MDHTAHCFAYAEWLARTLPTGVTVDVLNWSEIRRVADICAKLRAMHAKG